MPKDRSRSHSYIAVMRQHRLCASTLHSTSLNCATNVRPRTNPPNRPLIIENPVSEILRR